MRIAVCGAGAWGTTVALHLANQGHDVFLMPRRPEHATRLRSDDENRDYLPGFPFQNRIKVETLYRTILPSIDVVFLASPSYALREWCGRIKDSVANSLPNQLFISLAKGLEIETGKTPCEIIQDCLPEAATGSLSGPTFAGEVASSMPAAMTLAVESVGALAQAVQDRASGPNMRIYLSEDLRGVELGGCMKNVYAVAAGVCQGLGLGDNTLAALLTRALAEMVRVGTSFGAKPETFYGLSGFGDLVATCHGKWSRNRTFGELIAKGEKASAIIERQNTAVEGYRTAKAFHLQCEAKGIEAPILEQVYRILYEDKSPKAALLDLMSRDLKRE